MRDWNVVVTLLPEGYGDAVRILRQFGDIARSAFRDVLVMRIETDAHDFQEAIHELLSKDATLANAVARLIPVTATFSFETADEFRTKAVQAARQWTNDLADRSFYVRMHRRGFAESLNSHEEERAIGESLIEGLREAHPETRVRFDGPDFVIAVETVNREAGLSLWSRADLDRHELLRFE